jgi:hypothetical protein
MNHHIIGRRIQLEEVPATPQVMTDAQFIGTITFAADSVATLRTADVDRVLDMTPASHRLDMSMRIKAARPDLADEVDSAMSPAKKLGHLTLTGSEADATLCGGAKTPTDMHAVYAPLHIADVRDAICPACQKVYADSFDVEEVLSGPAQDDAPAKKLREDVTLSTGKVVSHAPGIDGGQVALSDVEMTCDEWAEYCGTIIGTRLNDVPAQDDEAAETEISTGEPLRAALDAVEYNGVLNKDLPSALKTSDLTGAALDWAVAKCAGCDVESLTWNTRYMDAFQFSTDWAKGGPIIERENICLYRMMSGLWIAVMRNNAGDTLPWSYGPTPLIAAMRCYVSSKLGASVSIPAALL